MLQKKVQKVVQKKDQKVVQEKNQKVVKKKDQKVILIRFVFCIPSPIVWYFQLMIIFHLHLSHSDRCFHSLE